MKIIGLLGGVASGKSTVAESFRKLGAAVLDADRMLVTKCYGCQPFVLPLEGAGERMSLDRTAKSIARPWPKLFSPRRPMVRGTGGTGEELRIPKSATGLRLKSMNMAQPRSAAVAILDAPVMLKAGWNKLCDALVFVDCPADQRLARATARGWTPGGILSGARPPRSRSRRNGGSPISCWIIRGM